MAFSFSVPNFSWPAVMRAISSWVPFAQTRLVVVDQDQELRHAVLPRRWPAAPDRPPYPTNAGRRDRQLSDRRIGSLATDGLEPALVRAPRSRDLRAGRAGVPRQAGGRHAARRRPGAACAAAPTCSASRTAPARPRTRPCCCAARRCAAAFILRALAIERWVRGLILVLLGVAVLQLKSTQVSLQELFDRDLRALSRSSPDPLQRLGLGDDHLDREDAARQAVDAQPDRRRAVLSTARCRSSRASGCGR